MRAGIGTILVSVAAIVGCQPGGTDRPHTAFGASLSALRSAFNADSGMVRVVILASPT